MLEHRPSPLPAGPTTASASVLVVNDDPGMSKAIRRILSVGGHDTTVCLTVAAAAEALSSRRPDLVIVDGDLGDRDYGPTGRSGRLVQSLMEKGIRFMRFSQLPECIPEDLRGEFCTSDPIATARFVDLVAQQKA